MKQRLQPHEHGAVSEFLDLLERQLEGRVFQTLLFGSKARGDSTPDSDIDILLVVEEDEWRLSHAISDLAADVSLEYDVLIAPRVIGRERWERMAKLGYSLYRNIVAEGIPLTPVPASS